MRIIFYTLKYIWKLINFARELFLNFVFFLFLIGIASGYFLYNRITTETLPPQKGTLIVDLEGIIVDYSLFDQHFYQLRNKLYGQKFEPNRENSLIELAQKIDQAAKDSNIKNMVLKLDHFMGADLSSLQYIGKYLIQFKKSNKKIYAIGSSFTQSQYYLASYADEIHLVPYGAVNVYGLSSNTLYYKTLLEKLKVNTHVFRVGSYKSAVEPFIRDDMSAEAKANTRRWLSLMWNNYLSDITAQRNQTADHLIPTPNVMISHLKELNGDLANYALARHLIDNITTMNQFELLYENGPKVSIYDYKLSQPSLANNNQNKPTVAVVFINGSLSDADTGQNIVNSQQIINQLTSIAENQNTKAVVIRINSPGGSVATSERIRSQLAVLRSNNIPIVVSMGNMAASGGYWIATESDYIIANPNTITGSIGIFGMVSTYEESLSKIGVYSDSVSTSPLAINSSYLALPNEKEQLLQINIENGYSTFLSLVSKSRHMSLQQADAIAQGQIWLGQEALEIGLVDQLGDIDDAIATAAKLANITQYNINWQHKPNIWFEGLFPKLIDFLPMSAAEIVLNAFPETKLINKQISWLRQFADPQNRYAYCLNCITIN